MSSSRPPAETGPAPRRQWISDTILAEGSVLVDELAERFGVSRMTIHRDLDLLERRGVLRKVTNGATAQPANTFESDVRFRLTLEVEVKETLSRAALEQLSSAQSICLDDATTLLPLARLLGDRTGLTIITNFLPIVRELTERSGVQLICLGGEYDPRFDTFTGLGCEQAASNLRPDVFVTSTTAISDGAAYDPDPSTAKVKRALMRAATQTLLLVDSSKFDKTALHRVAALSDFDLVLVDDGLDAGQVQSCREAGARMQVVPRTSEASNE